MRKFRLLIIVLAGLASISLHVAYSEAIPIEHNGQSGFFLTREDFEEVLIIMDERDFYEVQLEHALTAHEASIDKIKNLETIVEERDSTINHQAETIRRWQGTAIGTGIVAVLAVTFAFLMK